MARLLYDLCGRDPVLRFSPYCWRTKLALAQKGLEFETIPWRFTDRAPLAAHGAAKAGGRWRSSSTPGPMRC